MDDFLIRALLAGLGIALVCAPLGCFVVWRRMAYFGDSLAHSSLFGIAAGLVLGIQLNLSILLLSASFALLLLWLQQHRLWATDTLLGILAHTALAVGLILISQIDQNNVDIYQYLFGDILTVSTTDIYLIFTAGAIILGLLWRYWDTFTLMALHNDLAHAEGIPTFAMNVLFLLLMSLVVAISIRIVGIVLITSLLIIPAAAARPWAQSPRQMALLSCVSGSIAVLLGLASSWQWDLPSGPAIVSTASLIFCCSLISSTLIKR